MKISRKDLEIERTQSEMWEFSHQLSKLLKENEVSPKLRKVIDEEYRILNIFAAKTYRNLNNLKFKLTSESEDQNGVDAYIIALNNDKIPIQITCSHISPITKESDKLLAENGYATVRPDIPSTIPIYEKFLIFFSEIKLALNNKANKICSNSNEILLIGVNWIGYLGLEPNLENLQKLISQNYLDNKEMQSQANKFHSVFIIGIGDGTCHELKT